ncbi:MAG: POTRA domain-containing protein [Nostoc sp.]
MKNICWSDYIYRSSVIGFISSLGTIIFFCGVSHPIFAQSTPPTGVTIPPNTPERVEETIPKPIKSPLPTPATPETPSLPSLPIPTPPPSQETSPINERFPVKKIQILGNTVLKKEISNLVQEYEQKKEVSFEDLITLRTRITALYINNGYITSGAFILNDRPSTTRRK